MKKKAVLATIPSDCHSWNLLYMTYFLEELDFSVINLGVCTPLDLLADTCTKENPDLVVISTINGHGCIEGIELIQRLKPVEIQRQMPVVIGGILCINPYDLPKHASTLQLAGFDRVFFGDNSIPEFHAFLKCHFNHQTELQGKAANPMGPDADLYSLPVLFSDLQANGS
jgi:methylaspartate mutase sigma subunit